MNIMKVVFQKNALMYLWNLDAKLETLINKVNHKNYCEAKI
jgi:hypothetical protein